MSVSLYWKALVLWLMALPGAAYAYATLWWIRIPITLGLLTRFRLTCGALLLCGWIFTSWTWMNSVTSVGVLWVLTLFLWCTQEYAQRENLKPDSPNLYPL